MFGESVLRGEDPSLLRGAVHFIADLPPVEGEAAAVFVRSTVAHAELVSVDVSAAVSAPGVIGVYTAADLTVAPPGPHVDAFDASLTQPLLASGRVRHVGEPVVAVVADTVANAMDAAELVIIDYDELDAVTDPREAQTDSIILFPEPAQGVPTNVVSSTDLGLKRRPEAAAHDPDEPLVSVSLEVVHPRQMPLPVECNGMTCQWRYGALWVVSATQIPHGFRQKLAGIYGLPDDQVHVRTPAVGGGFGGKTSRTAAERVLPELSRLCGRPLRWIETRSEHLVSATQGRAEYLTMTLSGTAEGDLRSLRVELLKDAGAYPGVGAVLPDAYSAPIASGPYRIPEIDYCGQVVVTNAPQVGAFRGAGRVPVIGALERAVDLFAAEIGADPAEVRLRNLLEAGEMPWITATGARLDEADYRGGLSAVLAAADYDQLRADQEALRAGGGHERIGIGLACYVHNTAGGEGESAAVEIHDDGTATVTTGSTDQGHGHATTWAQIVATRTGIHPSLIRLVEGDTDAIADGVGAVGSRSVQTAGIAIHRASDALVERALAVCARLFEANVDDVVLDTATGRFHVAGTPALGLSWSEVVTGAEGSELDEGSDAFSCGDSFVPEDAVVPSGAHLCVVRVDLDTGRVRVERFVGVDDAGVRVNPMLVEGQLHGGIATGIGAALTESMVYDDAGTPRTGTLIDYAVVTVDMVPQFELHAAATATALNDLGVKAVGESGPVGATAAVHNAVLDALGEFGVDNLEIPLTPERVWRAIAGQT